LSLVAAPRIGLFWSVLNGQCPCTYFACSIVADSSINAMLKHDNKQLCPKYKKPIGDAGGILYSSAQLAFPGNHWPPLFDR